MLRFCALAVSSMLLPTLAAAQELASRDILVERLRPAISHEGIIDVDSAFIPPHLEWDAAIWLHYSDDAFSYNLATDEDNWRYASLVKARLGGNFLGAVSLFGWVQVGLDIPVVYHQRQDERTEAFGNLFAPELDRTGLSDIRLVPKLRILREEDQFISVALSSAVTFPTAVPRHAYMGDQGFGWEPEILVSRAFLDSSLRLAASAGWRVREEIAALDQNAIIDDELIIRGGLGYTLPWLPLTLEAAVRSVTDTTWPWKDYSRTTTGTETLFAARYLVEPVSFFVGTGLGAEGGHGTPEWRLFGGVALAQRDYDKDKDGLLDKDDTCPLEPEDVDGFADSDGCPDLDNDGDGIADSRDASPNDGEDVDQFQDDDGVPDPDNDADGILDREDQCPLEPETKNDYKDEDGCPDELPDSDGDGLKDPSDGCPNAAEDKDGYQDDDGCPDTDNDGDGVADTYDNCPSVSGLIEYAGCPDVDTDGDGIVDRLDNCPAEAGDAKNAGCKARQLVVLRQDKIEIKDVIHFETGKAVIMPKSFGLLDNIAEVLTKHAWIARVRVEGHTDNRGDDALNMRLSQGRAESVKAYLVGKGIAAERLEAVGFGETKPIASNASNRGRGANRRVEFNIVRGEAAEPALETAPPR